MSRAARGRESADPPPRPLDMYLDEDRVAAQPRDEREPPVSSHKFYVVRHAKAGNRDAWTGDDRRRPLTKKGQEQAERLVATFDSLPVSAVFSSPYLRCVQTVEPLARARGLEITKTEALAEGHGLAGAMTLLGDPQLDGAVLCTHGDIVWELVEELVRLKVTPAGAGGLEKGSTWLVEMRDGAPRRATFIAPP
jgi:8-oxo-dGTP diphosphatase